MTGRKWKDKMKNLSPIFNHIKPFDWCEAFYKFGFDDGDGLVRSYDVAAFLRRRGYNVTIGDRGLHNKVISSIKMNDEELLPLDHPHIPYGYDHPRNYLHNDIIAELDKAFEYPNASPQNEFTIE